MLGEQLLGELRHERGPPVHAGRFLIGRPAQPVVLHDEAVEPLERIALAGDLVPQVLGRGPYRLLEQRQEQLMFAAEVLVEASERLARPIDDLLDREVLPRSGVEQLDGGVEEALHPGLGPQPGGIQRARHCLLSPAEVVGLQRIDRCLLLRHQGNCTR
jgi:hypothetical protein